MWIFTTEGFVSAVQHRADASSLMVRARSEHALQELSLRTNQKIERTPQADYPFRITVSRETFGKWVEGEIAAVDYFNFKDAAHSLGDKKYDKALMQVWSAMYDSEGADTRTSS